MAGLNLPSLKIDILADGSSAITEIKNVRDAAREMINVGSQMTKFTTVPIVTALTAAVKSAGDFTETLGKTNVVFDEMTDSVMSWSENAIDAMGMAQSTALEMASTYGDMASGMGIVSAESASMSMNLTQLAADIASFKNKGLSEVNTALMGIFTGETESLKQLGIVMTQANLQQYAYSQGITQTIDKLSQAEQVQLRYSYVMAQSANAQGDFARTGDNLNNRVRKLTETLKELATSYGSTLTEKVAGVVGVLQQGAQYLAELDDGAKNTIVTIGLIVAAAGPLLLVGGKILGVITTLKASLLALSANPVTLGLMGAVAALSALTAITKDNRAEVDKSSEEYKRLKGIIEGGASGKISIDDSQVEELNKNPPTITVNADGQNALDEAQRIADILNGDEYDGMLAIDGDPARAEAALQELEDAINDAEASMTIDADGNAVIGANGEVERIQKAIDEVRGIVAITADPQKRAELESYLAELESQLANIGITASFSETPETDANIRALKEKLATLPKDETYSSTGEFKISDATPETIEEYATALAAAATATGDYADAVDKLNSIVDQETARKVEEINKQISGEAQYQAALLAEGLTTEEEAHAATVQAIEDGQALVEQIEKEAEAQKGLNEVYANGVRADDAPSSASALLTAHEGAELTDEQRTASINRLLQSAENGTIGDIQSQRDAQIALNTLRREAAADQEALINATERYNQAMATANNNEVAATKNAEAKSDMYNMLLDAAGAYYGEVQRGEQAETAMAGVLADFESEFAKFEGSEGIFQKLFTGENGELLGPESLLQVAAAFDSIEAMQAEEQAKITAAQEEATAAREAALQEFTANLASIQEGYTVSETAGIMTLVEQAGIAVSELDQAMITGGTQAIAGLAASIANGETDVESAMNNAIISTGLAGAAAAKSEGKDVGKDLIAGLEAGIDSELPGALAKARSAARQIVDEFKKYSKIQSPSKLMEDEVGVMLMRGLSGGVEKELPNVLQVMRRSAEGVISSATGVINNGAYTIPATITTANAPRETIDYDRLADAMANRPIAFSVGANDLATVTRTETARQQALRVQQINAGYGGKGALR